VTVAVSTSRRRPGDGGVAARRAVIRWAWRLFRREWRQQALILALLTIAVASAIGFGSAAYNTTGVSAAAGFGTANHLYEVDAPDARSLPAAVEAAEERFGSVQLITRWTAPIPGSVESIEIRSLDPKGPLSGPMLALLDGRYPSGTGDVALTDWVADTLGLAIGGTFDLDGTDRLVVGTVENPSDLRSEFALVDPTDIAAATSATLLVGGSGSFGEVAALRDFGADHLPNADITSRADAEHEPARAAAEVLGTAASALLLVSLVAAASFIVVAQRRLRQIGMLGAVGATEKHLRLVVLGNGAVIGIIAASLGAALGLTAWMGIAPRMEETVGYRIDPFNVPWWLIGVAIALALTAAVGAAWWPARSVARIPIMRALSGRPSRARPARRSAKLAGLLVAVGVGCLVLAQGTAALVMAGTVLVGVGVLLASPLAIQALGRIARWLPVAERLALRDLARYQTRSAFAVAAISLTLGGPAGGVIDATAAEHSADPGNVSDHQLLVWTRDAGQPEGVSPMYTEDPEDAGFSPYLPRLTDTDLAELEDQAERIAATLDAPALTGLDLVTDPAVPATPDGRLAVTLAQRTELGYLDVTPLFVATPSLLDHYGLDPETVGAGTEVITVPPADRLPEDMEANIESDDLWLTNSAGDDGPEPVTAVQTLTSEYTSLPGSFITADELNRRGWEPARVGWLIESSTPLTSEQLVAARELAADAGLLIETRHEQENLAALTWGSTAVSMLVALGVLAMTVGLIRNEAGRDLRTLAATGATTGIRRTITAATAGGLALSGAVLGTVGAYLVIGANKIGDLSSLIPVPIAHLAVIVIGVPVVAALAGWLVAGREPPGLARQPIE
jgi:putative ABC transport system permease protein